MQSLTALRGLKQQVRSLYNKVTLVGRVGKDPEFYEFKPEQQRGTITGKWQFNLVTSKSYKNPATNEWEQTPTWHRISTTKDMKAIGQGSLVLVEGQLKNVKDKETGLVQRTYVLGEKVISLQGKSPSDDEN